MPEHI